jgi:hypothetical protein
LQALYASQGGRFCKGDWGGCRPSFNLDGLVMNASETQGKVDAYTQIFRTGAMEFACVGKRVDPTNPEPVSISSVDMTLVFRERVDTFIDAAKKWEFAGPATLSFAILHVLGCKLQLGGIGYFGSSSMVAADRPHLIPPAVWIEDLATADLDGLVRPLLDTLCQAFGMARCPDFDPATGEYRRRSR